jgi:hypothetical protein
MLYGIDQAARAAGYFVSIASISSLTRRSVTEAVLLPRLMATRKI